MSRFYILSSGDGVGLALRLQAEGHQVQTWLSDDQVKDYGRGMIDTEDDYQFGQTIIADATGFGNICDIFRDAGIKTFSGSTFADKLEGDRQFAEKIMQDAGIKTPASMRASSWEEAASAIKRFAKKSGKVVIKPEGRLSGVVPSYVASSEEDALECLQGFERSSGMAKPELTIQEFLEGIAVSTEGWFNGQDWVEGMFNHTLEKKATLAGDLGPDAGCAGNVVWRCGSKDPIVTQSLQLVTDVLRKHRYSGPIDVNSIVNDDGVFGLEFTPRFGYDAFPTMLYALCDFDFGEFVVALARGELPEVSLRVGFGAGVRLSVPKDAKESLKITGFEDDDLDWFYPYAVQYDEENGLRSILKNENLGVVNGFGHTVGEAFAQAYSICSRVKARGLGYRIDLAEALLKDFRALGDVVEGENEGWIGIDLDGTLADYSGWSEEIGEPLPVSVRRVKDYIARGKEVRILTARGSVDGEESSRHEQLVKVHEWVKEHIGTPLEVTHSKDPKMIRLEDDRVRQVDSKTGALA